MITILMSNYVNIYQITFTDFNATQGAAVLLKVPHGITEILTLSLRETPANFLRKPISAACILNLILSVMTHHSPPLSTERSQLRWFGHLVRMPPGCLPVEVFQAHPAGKRPLGRPRFRWRDYISVLAWKCLGIPQSELADVARKREVWGPLLKLLPLRADPG